MSWAAAELARADLGDVRRNRRLVAIVEDLAASPESSVPLASRDRAALQGMYDFWANPRIRAEDIFAAHRASTIERIEGYPIVLAIQDTTELDYSHHPKTQGLGYLRGKHTSGMLLHSVLSVSISGVPFGLLDQRLWARTERRSKSKSRLIAQKESGRWLESLKYTEAAVPETTSVITIADREADIYELFNQPRRMWSELLIRVHQDRQVKLTPQGESQSLKQLLKSQASQRYFCLNLKRTPRREAQPVLMSVQWVSVWVQPPVHHANRSQLAPLRLQVVWAVEAMGEIDEPTISWMLVTTLPVANFEQACKYLSWYSYRWMIERYHYVLKSGCRVESLQLERFDRLERAIACYAIVAWRLLWLTDAGRGSINRDATGVLSSTEWQLLHRHYRPDVPLPPRPGGVRQYIWWITQLGGFWGRPSDGEPGARTIWRGLRRLRDLVRQTVLPEAIALAYV